MNKEEKNYRQENRLKYGGGSRELNKRQRIILTLTIIVIFITLTGLTYSWFSFLISGSGNDITVHTARLGIIYTDGPELGMTNAYPGQSISKTFTVENIGEESAEYGIYINDLINTFVGDEFELTLSEETNGEVFKSADIKSVITKDIEIVGGQIHRYTLTLTFKETGGNQNSNQGAEFSGIIQIREISEAALAVFKVSSITIDGVSSQSVPTSQNYVLENYNCTNGVVAEWNSTSREISLANVDNNNTECSLNFKQLKFKEVASGYYHTVALTEAGNVYAWGSGKSTPNGPIMSGVKSVSANAYSTIILTESGEVYTMASTGGTPQGPVMSGVKAISGGTNHTMALTESGEVYTWGTGTSGQLGDGTNITKSTPTGPIMTGVKAISAGSNFSMAVTESGDLYTWGSNGFGQLGDGTKIDKNIPHGPIMSGIKSISGEFYHAIALTESGQVYTWGGNIIGAIGDGTKVDKASPTGPIISGIKSIAGGMYYSMAVKESGEVYSWGDNRQGQLGDGTKVDKTRPVGPVANGIKVIEGGFYHTTAINELGEIYVWGGNEQGQLADGTISDFNGAKTKPLGPIISGIKAISGGIVHTMAITESDELYTWGYNGQGRLGDGTAVNKPNPTGSIMNDVKSVVGGNTHTIALTETGDVYTWGYNDHGQLGIGSTGSMQYIPQGPIISGVKSISTGYGHAVVLKETGEVYTWGYNGYGQLGNGASGNNTDENTPQGPIMSGVKAVAGGGSHTIALTESGEVYTWGYNYNGQLGDNKVCGNVCSRPRGPIMSGVKAISGGDSYTIALTEDGRVYTWGINNYGQLGDGTTTNKSVPTGPIMTGVKSIAGIANHTIVLTESGEVYTWGLNSYGHLGNGTITNSSTPTGPIMTGVKAIAGGSEHTIALTESGEVYAWGRNNYGQLGITPRRTRANGYPDIVTFHPSTYINSSFTYKEITSSNCSFELGFNKNYDKLLILPGNNIVNQNCRATIK